MLGLTLTVALGTLFTLNAGAASKQQSKAKSQAASTALATLKIQVANVTVKAGGKKKFVPAKEGQALKKGDAIKTDAAGKAEINYSDGSLTRLAPLTEYKITRLTSKRGGRQTQGALTVGQTWNRAAKVAETGAFEVKSGGTTAAVEGTAFVFSCALQAGTKVCQVIAVVDTVRVTTPGGAVATLTPATMVLVTDGTPGPITKLTYEDLIKLPFVVENINLDFAQGKGDGLAAEFPPPPPPPPTTPPDGTTGTGTGADGTGGTGGTGGTDGTPADNPPPPPPPDDVAPTISLTTPPNGAIYAQGQAVNASFSCADTGGSGLATCVASVANGGLIDTASLGVHSFSVAASDNAGNSAFVTSNYTVTDQVSPVVTITSPADGAVFVQGAVVPADFACSDANLVSCEGNAIDGGNIDTATLGAHQFTVVATDSGGNMTIVTNDYTVVDSAAPVVTITSPADGAVLVQGAVVPADFACSDANLVSCLGTVEDGANIDTSTLGAHTFTVTGTDSSGNTTTVTNDYTVTDQTAPVVTISTPPDGATYAQGAVVTADFACADANLVSCDGSVVDGANIDTSTLGAHTFTVTGTDSGGNATTVTNDYTVTDQAGPIVTILSPGDGAVYAFGEEVSASFSCTDEDGGSGLASCVGDVAAGQQIDTSSAGAHTFSVTATDLQGNTTTVTHSYTVFGQLTSTIVIPVGWAVQLSGINFSACNSLSYGYAINGTPVAPLPGKPYGCTDPVSGDDLVINPADTEYTLTIYLDDDFCGDRYFSDGLHVAIFPGEFQWGVAITDSGGDCESSPADPRLPEGGLGNLNLIVTLIQLV